MLLEFRTQNYKSFRDPMVFSMLAAPRQSGLDYSVSTHKISGKTYKVLSSAVIYGPNASGKTNLIGAMDTMKAIVMRGNINNTDNTTEPNKAAHALELIPCRGKPIEPTCFDVKFIESGLVVQYSFNADLGNFLNAKHPRSIISETLYINDRIVFTRNAEKILQLDVPRIIKHYMNEAVQEHFENAKEIAEDGLNGTELFLVNGFKSIFSKELVSLILNWFAEKFIVIYHSDALEMKRKIPGSKTDTLYVETTLTKAAQEFGINSNAIGFKSSKDEEETILCSLLEDGNSTVAVRSEVYESFGTVRFINQFPLVINALVHGGTLVIDEFDASIHPMALMSIINIFHNDDINKFHAQLVFNTHNPIFLNAGLFRRDEIKFVERNDETHESTHYSLSDFKTCGTCSVRKGEDYMSNYFINRYGAIRDVDFSSIIESIMEKIGDEEDE